MTITTFNFDQQPSPPSATTSDSVPMAFTAQQMARLTRISERRIRYWEETNVFQPTYLEHRERGPFRKIYTFRDLVSLRTLALLRDTYKVHLHELRRASEYLDQFSDAPWSDLSLKLLGKKVVFRDPTSRAWMSADATGQTVVDIDLEHISRESEQDARKLMTRTDEHFGKITRNRNIMSNAWVFSGTRVPIEAALSLHASGMSDREILRQYPTLVELDLVAAFEFDPEAQRAA